MTADVQAALTDVHARLRRLYGDRLARVVLFGSQARGDARPGSDVDVLVVLRGPVEKHVELLRLSGVASEVVRTHGELIGFVVADEAKAADLHHPLMARVREEGAPL